MGDSTTTDPSIRSSDLSARIEHGNIYVSAALCALYFRGVEAVALLAHGSEILILPLQEAAGGVLLKIRNAKGDRVIHAQEFLRQQGFREDMNVPKFQVGWDSDRAGLRLSPPAPEAV